MPKINSREKGKRIEREAAKYLESLGFETAHRTSQSSGDRSADIVCKSLPNIYFEVKGDEAIRPGTDALIEAWRKANRDKSAENAVVIHRIKRGKWMLTFASRSEAVICTTWGDERIREVLWSLNG